METASDHLQNTLSSNNDDELFDRLDTSIISLDTGSAGSHTVTASSDTLSIHSDSEIWEVLHEAEVQAV